MEDLIPTVNKLQDLVFNTIGSDTLDLPQVVVVGSQSCGKSSVLENVVGKDFLPRGTGIVTRRPLILQLVNVGANDGEHAEFLHIPNKRFYDFDEVRREIESETARIAGSNKGISRLPINLKVFSPHVLNLTLVDLPGLTKIPIGDQPTDIERQTRSLISEYIAKPNAIILAVSPANVDLVNSESLKLARQVDPQGKRTIGVLTKLDLMDHGTNALDILSGHVYPLKLGFIGVVNRSQQDIQERKSLQDSLLSEQHFFQSHAVYKNIAHRCGTQFLAKSLNQTLMSHIRERLPDIKARLNTLMGQTEQELASYGSDTLLDDDPQARGTLILQLMTRFASAFVASIDGTASDVSTKELCGGARIYYIYNDVFGSALSGIDPVAGLSTNDVRTAIRNSTGPRPSLFVPELAFDLLVKPQIRLLEGPAQRCVELVYEELMKICHNCGSTELERFPKLHAKLIEVISDLLRERLGPTSSYVSSLILIERAYINTNHPNFVGAAAAMSGVMAEKESRQREAQRAQAQLQLQFQAQGLNNNNSDDTLTAVDASPSLNHNNSTNNNSKSSSSSHSHKKHHNKSIDSGNSTPASMNGTQQQQLNNVSHNLGHALSSPNLVDGQLNNNNNTNSNSNSNNSQHRDSFLNYFFGKEQQANHSGMPNGSVSGIKRDGLAGTSASTHPPVSAAGAHISSMQHTGSMYNPFATAELENALDPECAQLSEREQLECELIRRLIKSYFDIVRQTIQDQVPKAVMHLLVNFCKESAQNRLVAELYKESLFDDLLLEDENLAQEREKCRKMLKTYREAARVVGEVI